MRIARRTSTVICLSLAAVVGTGLSASADFVATVVAAKPTIATLTVQPPTGVTVDDHCITTTVTTKRTVRTNPATGRQTQTAYSQTTTTEVSSTDVDTTTQSTTTGPGANDTTTTTVDKNTNLHVTVRWTASTTATTPKGISGYLVSAHLGIDNSVAPLLRTTATQASQVQDAGNLAYRPSLIVTTETPYGWTASAPRTAVLSC